MQAGGRRFDPGYLHQLRGFEAPFFDNPIQRVARIVEESVSSHLIKLLRALGGCLGAVQRRRTWLAAISLGERQTRVDPGISEWGNPLRANPQYPLVEHIDLGRRTG